MTIRVEQFNRITLPREIMRKMNIAVGDNLSLELQEDKLIFVCPRNDYSPQHRLRQMATLLANGAKTSLIINELEEIIKDLQQEDINAN